MMIKKSKMMGQTFPVDLWLVPSWQYSLPRWVSITCMLSEMDDADDGFWKGSFHSPYPSGNRSETMPWIGNLGPIRTPVKKLHKVMQRDSLSQAMDLESDSEISTYMIQEKLPQLVPLHLPSHKLNTPFLTQLYDISCTYLHSLFIGIFLRSSVYIFRLIKAQNIDILISDASKI